MNAARTINIINFDRLDYSDLTELPLNVMALRYVAAEAAGFNGVHAGDGCKVLCTRLGGQQGCVVVAIRRNAV